MKVKGVLSLVLVFAVVFSFAACRKLESSGEYETVKDLYIVDDLGETYAVETQVNEDTGETEYYYTDNLGNAVTVSEEVVVSTTKLSKVTTTGANGETESAGKPSPADAAEIIEALTDPAKQEEVYEMETVPMKISDEPIDTGDMKKDTPQLDSEGNPEHPAYMQAIDRVTGSDQYTIDITMKLIDGSDNITINTVVMKSGNNTYVETSLPVENGRLPIRILAKNGKTIIYFPTLRVYIEGDQDYLQELTSTINDVTNDKKEGEYQSSGTVEYGGTTYNVDIYKDDEGSTIKYYYLNDNLKRMEVLQKNGSSTIVEINSIRNTADKSKFIAPVGYINATDLMDNAEVFSGF